MHVLYGLQRPDAGEIWIDGQRMQIRSPRKAIRAGIGMVFQHFTLIPSLTVAENIALAGPSSHLFLRRKWLAARVQELAEEYRLAVDPTATSGNCQSVNSSASKFSSSCTGASAS